MVALSVAPVIAPAGDRDAEGATKRVVILNSTDSNLPAFLSLESAQREAINESSRLPVEFIAESLDMHHFPR
jgi:hypothetical protein